MREGIGFRNNAFSSCKLHEAAWRSELMPPSLQWISKSNIPTPVACLYCVLGVPMVNKKPRKEASHGGCNF